MSNTLSISIIIPVFNSSAFIKETLTSIKTQTYPHWEAIIVDDGSSDNTLELIKEHCYSDERFIIVQRSTALKGASVCRNIGLKQSKGDYVIFLDSDDILSDECLENRLNFANKFPEYDFWVFSTLIFNKEINDLNILLNVNTTEDALHRFLKMDVVWLTTGPFWRANMIKKIGGWDELLQSAQDWELSVRALILGLQFKYSSIVDNYWRVVGENHKISNLNKTISHLKLRLYLFNKIYDLLHEYSKLSQTNLKLISNLYLSLSMIYLNNNMPAESSIAMKKAMLYSQSSLYAKVVYWMYYYFCRIGFLTKFFKTKLFLKSKIPHVGTLKRVIY